MAFCANCGNKLAEGARFCEMCGMPVSGTGPMPPKDIPDPPPRPPIPGPYTPPRPTPSPNPGPNGPAGVRTAGAGSAGARPTGAGAAKPKGKIASRAGRMVKALICIPIALALIMGIIFLFEIDLSNMDGYAAVVTQKIYELDMFNNAAPLLGRIAVFGLAIMIVLSAYMLPARLTKTIFKTCTVMDKVIITIAGYFLIAFIIFLKVRFFDQGLIGRSFSLIFRAHGATRVKAVFLFALIMVLFLIPVAFIVWSFRIILSVIVSNLQVNGPVLGIIAAAYELLSSVFVTALVLCAASFGIAIILLPFIIMAACSSGSRVVYDEDGNIYYIN